MVIPGRVEDANPESRSAFHPVEIPGLALRAIPE
jgi:hypothetical protein